MKKMCAKLFGVVVIAFIIYLSDSLKAASENEKDYLTQQGREAIDALDLDLAITKFTQAIKIDPSNICDV